MKKGFFAYSSEPKYCGEFIEEAIKEINNSFSGIAEIKSWLELKISGNLIISRIIEEINNCDFFCADLTGMNDNVLFELGYAITMKKPIWIIFDESNIESKKHFKELGFFTSIGYSSYINSNNITTKFAKEEIYKKEEALYDQLIESIQVNENDYALFYVKGLYDTNYSQDIINEINYFKLPYLLDDPVESKTHPLTWYIEKIFTAPTILIEFSSTYRTGYEIHNSKCAFISGLSVGIGLRVLMVCENPYDSPLDFKELLIKYSNREECQQSVRSFLERIKDDAAQLILKRKSKEFKYRERTELQKIIFGEFIAEHESENIFDYFIETSHSQNLIKSEYNIVIGRKGTGKTATLYFLKQLLSGDIRNHICLIKPINFEIDGLITLFNQMKNEFESGFMFEAIWKFLIYTEISKSLYMKLSDMPPYAIDEDQDKFIKYVETNRDIILTDFSTRLEQEIDKLLSVEEETQNNFRIKVSEILHDNIIKDLKGHIVKNIKKNGKLIILIDNLDKSWRKDNDLESLSKFILGLLGVVGRISKDFRPNPHNDYKFTFHLTIFLRSDIFKNVMMLAREPDKIEYSRLSWKDNETLFRIIESRFEKLSRFDVVASDLWEKYIAKKVSGINTRNYISDNIFPRPRDLIYYLSSAKNLAVSRGHTMITESDLLSAQEEYSNWVFKSIIVENGISIEQMEEFMYNLLGENQILSETEIRDIAIKSKIKFEHENQFDGFIDHLVSLTILGREVKAEKFEYEYEFDSDIKFKILSKKLGTKRYRIHNALKAYLELVN